jgi:hypothetical protein
MSDYKAQTIGELIKALGEYDPNEIVIGAIFTAEDLVFCPDEDAEDDITPSQELMALVAKDYDNSDEAMFLSETLIGWAVDNYGGSK